MFIIPKQRSFCAGEVRLYMTCWWVVRVSTTNKLWMLPGLVTGVYSRISVLLTYLISESVSGERDLNV